MRYSRDERQAHIELWRESGLSRAAYCRKTGLTYQTFVRWVRLDESNQSAAEDADDNPFVRLWTASERQVQPSGLLRIEVCGRGMSLEVEPTVDDAVLLHAIRSLSAC